MKESDLYPPLKRYLKSQGYEIKAEIGDCDVIAIRGEEPPLIVELKLLLNLTVILQAVDRLALASSVYIGVPRHCSALKRQYRKIIKLLRMLGIGLITIDLSKTPNAVDVILDPGAYQPRQSKYRQLRLLGEFENRVGDPNKGGSSKRKGLMTAYRQRVMKVASFLQNHGAAKACEIARLTEESQARNILYRDVYGWFDRVSRGIYALSPRGRRELVDWLKNSGDTNK